METVERIKAQGGLVSIPHPYDSVRTSVLSADAMVEVLPHADIIEAFNARNVFRGADERARAAAAEHGLAVTAVSDSHHPWELGCTYTEMPEFDGTPQGFLAALREATLHPYPPPLVGTTPHARRDNLQQGCQPPAHQAPPAGVTVALKWAREDGARKRVSNDQTILELPGPFQYPSSLPRR